MRQRITGSPGRKDRRIPLTCLMLMVLATGPAAVPGWGDSARPGEWSGPVCHPEDLCARHAEIREEAVDRKDPQICNKITKRVYHQDYGVSPRQQRQQCKVHYAVTTGDVALCESMKRQPDSPGSLPWRDVCLSGLARQWDRAELCDDLYGRHEGQERDYYQAVCRAQAVRSLAACEPFKLEKVVYYGVEQDLYTVCVHAVTGKQGAGVRK